VLLPVCESASVYTHLCFTGTWIGFLSCSHITHTHTCFLHGMSVNSIDVSFSFLQPIFATSVLFEDQTTITSPAEHDFPSRAGEVRGGLVFEGYTVRVMAFGKKLDFKVRSCVDPDYDKYSFLS
jgi:hypothetical protein